MMDYMAILKGLGNITGPELYGGHEGDVLLQLVDSEGRYFSRPLISRDVDKLQETARLLFEDMVTHYDKLDGGK